MTLLFQQIDWSLFQVRLGQMTHRRYAGSRDGLDNTDADSVDERLRDVGIEGAPYPNHNVK